MNARNTLKTKSIGTGLLALFLSLPALAEGLPRIDFHKQCVVSHVVTESGVISYASIVCDGQSMQRGVRKWEQIDAWEKHLSANHFKETTKTNQLQARPYRHSFSTTYENTAIKPYTESTAQLSAEAVDSHSAE